MMKRILLIFIAALLAGACTTYETTVSGVQDGAFLKVVKIRKSENKFEDGVTLLIDEKRTTIDKVHSEKNSAKAMVVPITPGKHYVEIKEGSRTLFEKNLFIANGETRTIKLN